MISLGRVRVEGATATKSSLRVTHAQAIEVDGELVVSRAAHKLSAALDGFPIDPTGRLALDVGASTGGFTQILLQRGAREVIALDVGHDQLVDELRVDPRVRVVEGVNARDLTVEKLAEVSGTTETPTLLVADLSFISLRTVLPALVETVGTAGDWVLLVKPQFEVGRSGIRAGIVRDPGLRADAVRDVAAAAASLGLPTAGILSSPVPGGEGNREFLLWLSVAEGRDPTQWDRAITALADASPGDPRQGASRESPHR